MRSLRQILTTLLAMLAFVAKAQTDFRPGFIIKNGGDTLFGQLDYRGDALMGSVCKFRAADNAVQEFKPTDISGFRFTDSKYFVSKEVDGKMVFLEYLIKGKVNVYYLRDDKGDRYYIDREDLKLIELPYEEGIKVVDDKQVYYQTKKHFGILSYYMQDAQGIQPEIEGIKRPEHRNLIKLAEDYNNMVCKDEKCIIYEKNVPLVKVLIEPYIGVVKFQSIDAFSNEMGGFLYLSLPRTNERLFFKTGFSYGFAHTDTYRLNIYKIPLQLQYMYRVHRIQPKVSGGFNLLNINYNDLKDDLFYCLSLNAGVDYRLTSKLALTSSFNTDIVPLGYIVIGETQFRFSYSIIVGLRLELR